MGIKRLRASVFLLALVAAWCLAGGAAWAATKVIDITTASFPITITSATDGYDITLTGTRINDQNTKGILIKGNNDTQRFKITLDGIFLQNRPSAIQIVDGASVDLIIKGTNTIKTTAFGTNGGGDGMIHVGAVEKFEDGQNTTTAASELRVIGYDSTDRSKNVLIIDETLHRDAPGGKNGIDSIRLRENKGGGSDLVGNIISFKDVSVKAVGVLPTNRTFAFDTDQEVMFDNCNVEINGGGPIFGGLLYSGAGDAHLYCDFHFKNCYLDLTSTITGTTKYGGQYGAISTANNKRVTFCDSEGNSAIIFGTNGGYGILTGEVEVSGGAIEVSAAGGVDGIHANEISIKKTDHSDHPHDGNNGSIIMYVDKTNVPLSGIHVEDGLDVIFSETSARTNTTKYNSTTYPGYKVGNVWGDFELFDARDDFADYIIHDKELIVVQYDKDNPNTLNIAPDATLEIKPGGLLIIEPAPDGPGNVNDGVIKLGGDASTYTEQDIVDMIKGWGFTGTGIIDTPLGIFDNSGAKWGDIVDNSDPAQVDKLKGNKENLVVIGKDNTGVPQLVAVNPTKEDDAYVVPPSQPLDLKLVITDPADPTKFDKTYDPTESTPGSGIFDQNKHWMSSLIYPLNSDGTVPDLNAPGATLVHGPTAPVLIQSSTANFPLSVDDIRDLREQAKQLGIDSFVVWVYEATDQNDATFKGTIKKPFVFKVDSPEHSFFDAFKGGNEAQKENIKEGENLIVFKTPAAAGSTSQQFVSLNPTASDPVYDLPRDNALQPALYIANTAKDTKINGSSSYESKKVVAKIRPLGGSDYMLSDGPYEITDGYVNFNFTYPDLYRMARRARVHEFVMRVYDEETNGSLVEHEFVFRMYEADVDTHGTHCAGCDTGVGIALAAGALAVVAMRRRKES